MLVYDLEIENAVPPRDGQREEGISYCEGWHDYAGMGISVVGVYDYGRDQYRVFFRDNLPDFLALARNHDLLIGFNNTRFDNPVLASAGISIHDEDCYDLFTEVQRGLGLDFNDPAQRRTGYGLQAFAQANFRIAKTGDGATAPLDWQRGLHGKVADYCLNDVYLTKRLVDRVIRHGSLTDPQNPQSAIRIRRPGS